jgi:Amt family ammonium transporter
MKKRIAALPLWVAVAAPALLGQEAPDMAQLQAEIAAAQSAGDNAWMLVCCALVLMMTGPGLLLFYGGLVRRKNVLGTMMQCFILMAVISVLWAVVGYSLAFAEGNVFVGGLDHVFLRGVGMEPSGYAGTIPHYTFMLFQLMFAIITPALITGAFAERMKFSAMLLFMLLWSTFVYNPLAHAVWGEGGILVGYALDFAGGTVVHISSGVAALVLALVIGKRSGYGKEPIIPHNLTLSIAGAGILWFGWFGFNAGSALAADGLAASAFVATHFAAAAATLSWNFAEWIWKGKPSALGAISGAVAGLVAITPAAGFVTPMSALVIGAISGVLCFWACTSLKNKLGYDDSLDVFGIHGVGGTTGAILTGVFASEAVGGTNGLLYGNPAQLLNQVVAVAGTWIFVGVLTFIIIKLVGLLVSIRVSDDDEDAGLDISQHGESGYNL